MWYIRSKSVDMSLNIIYDELDEQVHVENVNQRFQVIKFVYNGGHNYILGPPSNDFFQLVLIS